MNRAAKVVETFNIGNVTSFQNLIFPTLIVSCWPNSKFTSSLSRYSSQQTSPGKLQELAQIVCMQRHLSPYTSLDCLASS